MTTTRRLAAIALATCSVFALSATADTSALTGGQFSLVSAALAGNGNGNGGGHGGGNSGGHGGGHAGEHGGGKSAMATGHGKSGSAHGSNPIGNFVRGILGKDDKGGGKSGGKSGSKSATKSLAKTHAPASKTHGKSERSLAEVPVPAARPGKEKSFDAKLAGLHSLNRNFHAYLNSSDPRMAAIRDYVMASVDYEKAQAAVADAKASLDDAATAFAAQYDAILSGVETYDDYTYDSADLAALNDRYDYLASIDQADLETDQIDAINGELNALGSLLGTAEAADLEAAQADLTAAQDKAGTLEAEVSDEALTEALLAAANKNRVAEYGVDDYVDTEMLDWAKGILGVGDEYGKIDEIAAYMDEEATTDGSSTEDDTATVEDDTTIKEATAQ